MIQTIVQRLPADKQGTTISDALLTSQEAQIARGRGEINDSASMMGSTAATFPETFISPTTIIQVTDIEKGRFNALVSSYSMSFSLSDDSFTATSSIQFERAL